MSTHLIVCMVFCHWEEKLSLILLGFDQKMPGNATLGISCPFCHNRFCFDFKKTGFEVITCNGNGFRKPKHDVLELVW